MDAMPVWNALTDLTNAALLFAALLFGLLHDKVRKNQRRFPFMFLAALFLGFMAVLIRGLSFLLVDQVLHRLAWAFQAFSPLFLVVWMEQIVFETPRVLVRSLYTFLAGMSIAFSWVPENIRIGPPTVLAWAGMWEISGQVFVILVYIYVLTFFIRLGMKATWKVRVPLAIVISALVFATYGLDVLQPLFPAIPISIWSILAGILTSLSFIMVVFICVAYPEFLSIITYTLDRLIVIHADNGVLLFSHSWVKRKHDDVDLIAPLLQALQSMSFEVLKLGHMTELHLEEGNLMFQKSDHVIVGVISSRSTVYLRTRLSMFIDAFEIQFRDNLDAMDAGISNEISVFQRAKGLVDKIFQAIPLDTTRFGPWRRHLDEKDYLSPDEDPDLINDLKSLFSNEI
jgi:hypothetical protein